MTPGERNQKVEKQLDELFDKAAEKQFKALDGEIAKELDLVFSCKTWGFREILLVIVHARLLDPEYRASVSFYDCNPRPLFEGPIRTALSKRGIPHRQSGPLNIAKAAQAINGYWAARLRVVAFFVFGHVCSEWMFSQWLGVGLWSHDCFWTKTNGVIRNERQDNKSSFLLSQIC